MDMQGIIQFAYIQTKGAAYLTFYLSLVPKSKLHALWHCDSVTLEGGWVLKKPKHSLLNKLTIFGGGHIVI